MNSYEEKVAALRAEKPYNCAQTVYTLVLAEAGQTPGEEMLTALKGFGGGLGCGDVCGCLTGGAAALSRLAHLENPEDGGPCRHYATQLTQWFYENKKTTLCDTLLEGQDKGTFCPALMAETLAHCAALLREEK